MTRQPRPIWVYSDETGQHSHGEWLVVAAVIVTEHRRVIEQQLEAIEVSSGKRQMDWHSCDWRRLNRYLACALAIPELEGSVSYQTREGIERRRYHHQAIGALLDLAEDRQPVSRAVFVPEGFTRSTRRALETAARARFPKVDVWSSGFNGSATVRLADSLAGLISQVHFRPDSNKAFPDLMRPSFVRVQNETPRTHLECAGGQA